MGEKRIKYDRVSGDEKGVVGPFPVAASEAFKLLSGKFVYFDGSRRLAVAGSGNGELAGWALVGGDLTASSTAGATKLMVDTSFESIFELPYDDETLTEAQLDALMLKTCDLITASNIQKADVGESNEDTLILVGYDYIAKTVKVKLNPAKFSTTGVV